MTDNCRGIGTLEDRLRIYAQPTLGQVSPEAIKAPLSSGNMEQQGVRRRQRALRVRVRNRDGHHMLHLYVPAGAIVSRRARGQCSLKADLTQTVPVWPVVSITTDRWEDDGGAGETTDVPVVAQPATSRQPALTGTEAISVHLVQTLDSQSH